jgi:hypothetical protein
VPGGAPAEVDAGLSGGIGLTLQQPVLQIEDRRPIDVARVRNEHLAASFDDEGAALIDVLQCDGAAVRVDRAGIGLGLGILDDERPEHIERTGVRKICLNSQRGIRRDIKGYAAAYCQIIEREERNVVE